MCFDGLVRYYGLNRRGFLVDLAGLVGLADLVGLAGLVELASLDGPVGYQ